MQNIDESTAEHTVGLHSNILLTHMRHEDQWYFEKQIFVDKYITIDTVFSW